jgi:hypothetical protein
VPRPPPAAGCRARTFDGTVSATTATVTVTVRRASRTQLLQLGGINNLNVSATATATATAIQGVTGPNT